MLIGIVMNLMTDEIRKKINNTIINNALEGKYDLAIKNIQEINDLLYKREEMKIET
jgi:hypothetical protein